MDNNNRLLGELIASHKNLREDVSEIKKDVKELNEFKWSWNSKMTAYSGIVATVVTLFTEYFIYRK